jgi:hypothetical protein
MRTAAARHVVGVIGLAGLAGACLLGGCGWTPRDEFIASRNVVFAPSGLTETPDTPIVAAADSGFVPGSD